MQDGDLVRLTFPRDGDTVGPGESFAVEAECDLPSDFIRGVWEQKDAKGSVFMPCSDDTMIRSVTPNPFPIEYHDVILTGALRTTITGEFDLRVQIYSGKANGPRLASPPFRIKVKC